jgi:6-pyruvoyltetrahydropterin/6-carboxytetrahydropterin synthase
MDLKKKINVTKIFTFDSAHNLLNYEGKCKNLHGHTYKLEVTIRGISDERGIVIDFSELKQFVNEVIIEKMDHKYLNDILEFNTTCENMVVWIFNELNEKLVSDRYFLQRVKLWETPTSFAEIEREDFFDEG